MIAIFTKFDDLVKQIYDKNLEMAENCRVALAALDAKFQALLSKFKFPPNAYLRLEGKVDIKVMRLSKVTLWETICTPSGLGVTKPGSFAIPRDFQNG